MKNFNQLGVQKSLIKGLNEINIDIPTEIQEKAIPFLIEKGTDFIGQAQTGTGKTLAFGLPILQKINPENKNIQALILSPTRELGQQIAKQIFKYTKYSAKVFTECVYGGTPIGKQIAALRRPTQIVVATPGRLVDLLERNAVDINQVKIIVLDEADEMLTIGFKKELEHILGKTVGKRSIWLFSATMPKGIKNIIEKYMNANAHYVRIDKKNIVNKNIDHKYVICELQHKVDVLNNFLRSQEKNRGVIFCKTKVEAQTLAQQLKSRNHSTDAIHGDLMQKERDKVMRTFKNKKLQILIATDLAARGIDVENLSYVVHFTLPDQIEYYTHRSGRTARAGKKGLSLILITTKELSRLHYIENILGITSKQIKNNG